jgi:hypothetical protein
MVGEIMKRYYYNIKQKIAILSLCCLVLGLVSCQKRFEYVDVKTFSIQQDALANKSSVAIIYCSGGPKPSMSDSAFYYRLIVIDTVNSDTFNVLTTDIKSIISGKVIDPLFISQGTREYPIALAMQQQKVINISGNNTIDTTLIVTKVVRNPKFKDIEQQQYTTVIGAVVDEKQFKEYEKQR